MKSRKDGGKWNLEFFIYNEGRIDQSKCVIETTSLNKIQKLRWSICSIKDNDKQDIAYMYEVNFLDNIANNESW